MFGKKKPVAAPKLKHVRPDGEIRNDFSSYCPECGFHVVEKEVLPGVDFDEHGWFQAVKYQCKDTKCNHTWQEKVIVKGGTQAHHYGK